MKVKLCGFTEKEPMLVAIKQNCDFLGFVFYEKSIRNISLQKAEELKKFIPSQIKKVAVVVDPTIDFIKQIIHHLSPDYLQFHGNESASFLNKIKNDFSDIGLIKAFKIERLEDLELTKEFENVVDYFLFDSTTKDGQIGGSGQKFDWSILKNLNIVKTWFLSGGINAQNVASAIQETNAKMIDISSGIEENRGTKSARLIIELMQRVRNL